MVAASIMYELSEIHYRHFGTGPTSMVCLHGYGESSASFAFLTEHLSHEYTLVAIDLPFHGATQWREERAFTCRDLVLVIDKVFDILAVAASNVMLLGYSMGGRIALSLLEEIPGRISRLILLAPDGIKVNFWYWLATQTTAGSHLFRFMMNKPYAFLNVLQTADRFKLINKSLFKFTRLYSKDENDCNRLFDRWTCMRTFNPRPGAVRNILRKYQLPLRIVYGKHDRIIYPEMAAKITAGLGVLCQVHIIDAGHQLLQKKYASIIIKLLTA